MSLDQLLTDVLASPPDTEWSVDAGSCGIHLRTYRGHRLLVVDAWGINHRACPGSHSQVVDEHPDDGCSWAIWSNHNSPNAEGDAPSVDIAKLRAERAAEGEDGGPATDTLKMINDYTEDVTP